MNKIKYIIRDRDRDKDISNYIFYSKIYNINDEFLLVRLPEYTHYIWYGVTSLIYRVKYKHLVINELNYLLRRYNRAIEGVLESSELTTLIGLDIKNESKYVLTQKKKRFIDKLSFISSGDYEVEFQVLRNILDMDDYIFQISEISEVLYLEIYDH